MKTGVCIWMFGVVVGLAGCAREDQLIGVWRDQEGETLTFQSDGTVLGSSTNTYVKIKPGRWKRLGDGRVAVSFVRYFGNDQVICETTSTPGMMVLECTPDVGQIRLTPVRPDAEPEQRGRRN